MKRPVPTLAGLIGLLWPLASLADGPSFTVDLTTGALRSVLASTLGLAQSLLPLVLVLGLLLEAFGSSPIAQKDYVGVLWRFVLVLFALISIGGSTPYARVAGTVINLTEGMAKRIAPANASESFNAKFQAHIQKLLPEKEARAKARESANVGDRFDAWLAETAGELGGSLFNACMTLLLLLGELSHWLMTSLGRILALLMYLVGPLALVFSVPRGFGTAGAWFRAFVTYCTWPILSGLILRIVLAVGLERIEVDEAATTVGALASALLLAATALVIPSLANALVAAGASNFASQGLAVAQAKWASGSRAMQGAAQSAGGVARGIVGRFSGAAGGR